MQSKMAAGGSETAQGFQQLFKDISLKFSSLESVNILKILKNNYGRKIDLLDNRDLLEGLHVLKKHGYVYDNHLILIEDVIAPKSDNDNAFYLPHYCLSSSKCQVAKIQLFPHRIVHFLLGLYKCYSSASFSCCRSEGLDKKPA